MNDNFIKRFAKNPNLANAESQLIKEFEQDISYLKSIKNELEYIYGYMCGYISHYMSRGELHFNLLNVKLLTAFYNIYGEKFIDYAIKRSDPEITKADFMEIINS